ncbi:MAG: hypothetical protein CM1200mP3_16710 [Chloroflexota bacterium]|nr:MAG: hypothetical protein CM1200mP3_16710 [Chloroflexota bacterium]
MITKQMTGTPSDVLVEQLVASGVKYVFYNSGSREALFFDALNNNPNINGILALHKGDGTLYGRGLYASECRTSRYGSSPWGRPCSMYGPVIQHMVWWVTCSVITFAGDTGSFTDRINLIWMQFLVRRQFQCRCVKRLGQ